ncbi:CopG family antitoxin [Polynucleobacter rarus]|uniref:CopG family antitoxin n=1 Tax=Polynucleobacter rarus TaxID=556055 RepID=UPI001FE62373|nr:CopG family antitoxin [Polynucleobacter rarus]
MHNKYDSTNFRDNTNASNLQSSKTKDRNLKPIPKFNNEESERQFWESPENDATEYFEVAKMVVVNFSNLKPSTTSIS